MDKNKIRFSQEEMAQLYAEAVPYMVPNHSNVGRFAKKQGFVRMKQVVNHKQIYFYVKKEDL